MFDTKLSVFLTLLGFTCTSAVQQSLEDEFRSPSAQYRPKFRYWLPDASISADVLAEDVKAMADVGVGGFELLPYYQFRSPSANWSEYAYGTEASQKLFHTALVAANETGLLLDFALGGNQGQGVPAAPESLGLAVELAYVNLTIDIDQYFNGTLPLSTQPESVYLDYFMYGLEDFGQQNLSEVLAVEVNKQSSGGIVEIGQVINLSSLVDWDKKSLVWTPPTTTNAPANSTTSWRLMAWYERYTNQRSIAAGPNPTNYVQNGSWIIDHFSAAGSHIMTNFFEKNVLGEDPADNELLAAVGKYAWEDSMEMQTALWWTHGFAEKFRESRGYEIAMCLPFLIVDDNFWAGSVVPYGESFNSSLNGTFSDRCIDDYRITLQEGYREYVAANVEWAHSKGVEYSNQPGYNLPLNMLDSIPLVDAPEGESLGFADKPDAYRHLSGPAHLARIPVISSECGALSTAAYTQTISDLLWSVHRGLATGISMHVFHGFSYTGTFLDTTWPGFTIFGYTYTDMWTPNQPQWQHINDSLTYVARNQFVSQTGVPKVDLAFYSYNIPFSSNQGYTSNNLQDIGFTYDYLGPGSLENDKAVVQNGILAPDGPEYKALVFTNHTKLSLMAAVKVSEWAQDGLPIFLLGDVSFTSIGRKNGEADQVVQLMSEVVNTSLDNVYRVRSTDELPDALASASITPRVTWGDHENIGTNGWYSFWRSTNQTELAFIYNDAAGTSTVRVDFSNVSGMTPYILDAWTGVISPVLHYSRNGTSIVMPITLAPNQTTIIAFKTSIDSSLPPPPKAFVTSVSDGVIDLGYAFSNTSQVLLAYLSGQELASVTLSTGETRYFNTTELPEASNLTTWDISIQDWHAADDIYSMETAIDVHTYNSSGLAAWVDIDPVALTNTSGIGQYTTRFNTPAFVGSTGYLGARLHLGSVTDSMRVWVNGARLPPVEAMGGGSDVVINLPTAYMVPNGGAQSNELRIEVATTLYNRIRADMDTVMTLGQPVSFTNAAYFDANPAKSYGLVGPVWIEWMEVVEVS